MSGLSMSPLALLSMANTWTAKQQMNAALVLYLNPSNYWSLVADDSGGLDFGFRGDGNDVEFTAYGGAVQLRASLASRLSIGGVVNQSTPTIASGTVYQNGNFLNLTIYLPVYASTAGTDGTIAFALGTSSSPSTIWTDRVSGSTTSAKTDTKTLFVPANFYWSVTTSGATLGTPTQLGGL